MIEIPQKFLIDHLVIISKTIYNYTTSIPEDN
jgi:hypothetical protein